VIAAPDLPKVVLTRNERIRFAVVALLVVLALGRVVPDVVRVVYPLHYFGYVTDRDGVVIKVSKRPLIPDGKTKLPGGDPVERLQLGDRVRIDRIKPWDRKPGLVGEAFTYDNVDRRLPIERDGKERIVRLIAHVEPTQLRFLDMLRILLFLVAIGLGAILFLVKPSIATGAFFVFCLGGVDAPATYLDGIIPYPWRQYPQIIDNAIAGAVRPALWLFAFCLIDGDRDAARERVVAWIAAAAGLALGVLHAYSIWRLDYAGLPAERYDLIFRQCLGGLTVLTMAAFVVAFVRAKTNDRHRIGWIVAAFAFAGIARLTSDALFPAHIQLWVNSLLVSMTIVPIITIWIAVVRHQFFNVDFVVSKAVVYFALSAAVFGSLYAIEEIGTYIFSQNSDLAYGFIILICTAVGSLTGKIKDAFDMIVDRFIFRDRHQQRKALEFIAGYILDAETVEDVHRALLQDAPHALNLQFGGILERQPDGGYELAESFAWPDDCIIKLGPSDELTQAITRTRGALTFSGKDTRLIQRSFPNERLTFAAPLFFDRTVSGIVVYGHNVSGLDLDPEERELLVRVVTHGSISLNAIELARYRGTAPPPPAPAALSAQPLGTG
jgi:hypothetical protein